LFGKLLTQPVQCNESASELVGFGFVACADPSFQFVQSLELSHPQGFALGTFTQRQRPQKTLSSVVSSSESQRSCHPSIRPIVFTQRQRLFVGIAPRCTAIGGAVPLPSFIGRASLLRAPWTPRQNTPTSLGVSLDPCGKASRDTQCGRVVPQFDEGRQRDRTLVACGPLGPCSNRNETACPAISSR
jgi:hypothetical protein